MKTATKETLEKKLNSIKTSKNSIAYKLVQSVLNGEKEIKPCYTSGSKKFITNQDYTHSTQVLLNAIGIEYKLTNTSPRGGLTGNLITILTKIK